MPDLFEPIEKQYYSIGEVSEILSVNASLVRFWETEFPELSPKKNKKGNRIYTREDLELLQQIHYLVKVRRFTLEGARHKMKTDRKAVEVSQKTRETLSKLREFLVELRNKV